MGVGVGVGQRQVWVIDTQPELVWTAVVGEFQLLVDLSSVLLPDGGGGGGGGGGQPPPPAVASR